MQGTPFDTPALADGLYGGLIPTPPDQYAQVWRWPRPLLPALERMNHDLRDYSGATLFAPVGDQGQIGSCAAWAASYYLRSALASKYHVDNGTAPDLPDTLSPRFHYDLTRDRMGTYPQDSGSDMHSCMSVLLDYGVAPERDCPYTGLANNGPIDQAITPHMKEAAGFYGISGYYRLAGSGDVLLDSIEGALHQGQPVVIAFLVPSSFMRTGANGRIPNPGSDEQILGAHAMCVGANYYDTSFTGGRCLVGPNSWGTAWGEGGWFYMPASYARTSHRNYGPYLMEAWTVA
jgi:C1A family cysteine protease